MANNYFHSNKYRPSKQNPVSAGFDSSTEDECCDTSQLCYGVTDFDQCRITQIKNGTNTECLPCEKRNKTINTMWMCSNCNIPCCIECYDCHRQEQLLFAIKSFLKHNERVPIGGDEKCSGSGENAACQDSGVHYQKKLSHLKKNKPTDLYQPSNDLFLSHSEAACKKERLEQTLTPSSLKSAILLLKEHYEVISEVMFDADGKFKCMYFQDSYMKDCFNFFPHRLCIDITGKITDLDVFLTLFLIEDSNGHGDVISVALTFLYDAESLKWLLTMFKKHNPHWRAVKLVLADPCIQNHEVVKTFFPGAHFLQCFYHASRTFRNGLDHYSFDIPLEHKTRAAEIFQGMVFAFTEVEYNTLYEQLHSLHSNILEYFEKVWHPVKHEWRILIEYHQDILYAFNNYLFYLHHTMSPVFCANNSLCGFIKKFFFVLKLLRVERSKGIVSMLQTVQLSLYSKFTPQFLVSNILTAHSAAFVNRELDYSAEVNINPGVMLENYVFCYSGSTAVTSSSCCTCKFFLSTALPCYHIFAVRRVLTISMFDESLCFEYWTKKYYFHAHKSLLESFNNNLLSSLSLQNSKPSKIAPMLADQLFSALLNCPVSVFEERISLLKNLISTWKNCEESFLQFSGSEVESWSNVQLMPHPQYSIVKEEIEPASELFNTCNASEPNAFAHTNLKEHGDTPLKPNILFCEWDFGSHLLEGKFINFVYLSNVICKTKETCIDWLRHMEFLPSSMMCPSCRSPMKNQCESRLSDGAVWICKQIKGKKRTCAKRCTVRHGTWFEGTNLSLDQILLFIYMWVHRYGQQQIVLELGISAATYIVWDKSFRKICDSTLQDELSSNFPCNDSVENNLLLWLQKNSTCDHFIAFLYNAAFAFKENNMRNTCS